ncbi:Uncharacterised protein [Staphylococcus aureus]|nr:Uncharacterised protein [Staphylococcus aureus]
MAFLLLHNYTDFIKNYQKNINLVSISDEEFNRLLHHYVLHLGIKLYVTKDIYYELKKVRVTTSY